MSQKVRNILVLCTGNSARSILGEAIFNMHAIGRFQAYSAGSQPRGMPHPGTLRLLQRRGIDISAFRSKNWDEFSGPDAPKIDIAITVCGNAAGEICPIFMGSPIKAHWGLPDPADVSGSDADVDAAFAETWRLLDIRVKAFLELDFDAMGIDATKAALAKIGQMEGAA